MFVFFFTDTATTEIYTLSLHDALPISVGSKPRARMSTLAAALETTPREPCAARKRARSEEHTSELQSQSNLVCRLLLEKKNEHTNLANHPHSSSILRHPLIAAQPAGHH